MITFLKLVAAARDLASDDGDENPEYDRALVELVSQFLPGDSDNVRAYVETLVMK